MMPASRQQRLFQRGAFSVLELVVAMTLGIVLLSAIWTMFSIFAKRREADRIQTETSQLIRGLHQVFSRDVSNIVPQNSGLPTRNSENGLPPPTLSAVASPILFPNANFGSAELETPKVGSLVGSATEVQFLVFDDGSEWSGSQEPKPKERGFFFYRPAKIDWPFRIVVYRFESGHASKTLPGQAAKSMTILENEVRRSGLTRRESFFGSRNQTYDAPARSDARTEDDNSARFETGTLELNQKSTPHLSEQLISEETVTEFSDFSFEYFDGVDWRESWDSRETGTLPFAVRARFNLKLEKQRKQKPNSDDSPANVSDDEDSINQQSQELRRDHEFILAVAREAKLSKTSPTRSLHLNSSNQ